MNFEKVASFGEQNENKIEKPLQVEDLSEDGQQANLQLNLIKILKDELKPEFDALKEAQAKLTLTMAALTEKISEDCFHKNEIVKVLSEFSTLKAQMKISLNDQKNELSSLREEIKISLNDQKNELSSLREEIKISLNDQKNELSSLREEIETSLNDQKNELSSLREEIETSLNDQNQTQAAFDEQLKRIEAAIKSVTTTTPVPTTKTTPAPKPMPPPMPIKNAKFDENLNCIEICGDPKDLPNDCSEVKNENKNENGNGIFVLKPPQGSQLKPFGAYCTNDENKNWIIILRRYPKRTVSFERTWEEFKNGFGDLDGDYWLGLERIHQLTTNRKYELRMNCMNVLDIFSSPTTHYSEFSVADEGNGYKLKVDGFSGDLDYFKDFNGSKFSTSGIVTDDNKSESCARQVGYGWWCTDGCYKGRLSDPDGNLYSSWYIDMAIHPA